jgi:hypothetical protein
MTRQNINPAQYVGKWCVYGRDVVFGARATKQRLYVSSTNYWRRRFETVAPIAAFFDKSKAEALQDKLRAMEDEHDAARKALSDGHTERRRAAIDAALAEEAAQPAQPLHPSGAEPT